jgi:hypothetical protein
MAFVVLAIVAGLLIVGFLGLYVWTRRLERDTIFWPRRKRSSEEAQADQLGIALNVNDTFSR